MEKYFVVDKFLEDSSFRTNIAVQHLEPAREATWVNIPQSLHDSVRSTLENLGYQKLYKHQDQAINSILEGYKIGRAHV